MTELTCPQCRELAPELALDVLTSTERARALAHLDRCANCRDTVCALTTTADRLIELLPDSPPPAGFEQRVLTALTLPAPATRRWWQPAAAVLLAVALAGGGGWTLGGWTLGGWALGGWALGGRNHDKAPAQVTAQPGERSVMFAPLLTAQHQGTGSEVGQAYVYPGQPAWMYLSLDIDRHPTSGTVRCELVRGDGSSVPIGTFRLTKGYAAWGIALTTTVGRGPFAMAKVIDSNGDTLATAHFTSPLTISHQLTNPPTVISQQPTYSPNNAPPAYPTHTPNDTPPAYPTYPPNDYPPGINPGGPVDHHSGPVTGKHRH
ncbi:MAG: anti-sigma factor family protein [Pseudonocardiaceae bacterium]